MSINIQERRLKLLKWLLETIVLKVRCHEIDSINNQKKKIEATMKISSQEIFTFTTISYCTDQLIQMTYCWQAEFA